jgi:hypothetical protein
VADYPLGYTAPAGVWTHLAFVGTASSTSLYANGVLKTNLNVGIPLPRGYLGAGYWAVSSPPFFLDYMLGSLDEVLVFNRNLSAAEINAIYAAGSSGVVRVPEFTGVQPLSANQIQINLRGLTGKNIKIYASQDLDTWSLLTTVANSTGNILYTDNSATNGLGFYRAAQ